MFLRIVNKHTLRFLLLKIGNSNEKKGTVVLFFGKKIHLL